jgi:hypothetical protein
MLNFPECDQYKSDIKIVIQENQSKIIIENYQRLKILVRKVDGCAIKQGKRCDYMVIPNDQLELYIELKGNKIYDAIEQLEITIKTLSENYRQKRKECFIISSRTPSMDTIIQNAKQRFKKRYNSNLTIKNKELTYKILL